MLIGLVFLAAGWICLSQARMLHRQMYTLDWYDQHGDSRRSRIWVWTELVVEVGLGVIAVVVGLVLLVTGVYEWIAGPKPPTSPTMPIPPSRTESRP